MNKSELVSAIAKRADVPSSTVDSVLNGLQEELVEAITRGDKVAVPGLLTVERSQRSARTGGRLARWVGGGQLPGFLVTVARHGRLVHVGRYGHADVEAGRPVTDDTRWRIYSMTKPVTSVAAMSLYEEGAFELNDPISR